MLELLTLIVLILHGINVRSQGIELTRLKYSNDMHLRPEFEREVQNDSRDGPFSIY